MDTSDGIQLHGWIMWDHRRSINTLKEIPTIIFFQVLLIVQILNSLNSN